MGRLKELFKDINESAARISKITGRGKLSLKIDMLSCLLKYKASPNNYEKFEFYRLKRAKRKTYVTYGISRKMITRFNAPVDFNTGIIHKPAATFGSELYENHPTTGARILGVKVPFWNEILKMLDSACRKVPTVRYIGWDVAITPCGPVIIEGNTTPGYKYYQIPAHLSDGIGNKDLYAVHLKRKKTK